MKATQWFYSILIVKKYCNVYRGAGTINDKNLFINSKTFQILGCRTILTNLRFTLKF